MDKVKKREIVKTLLKQELEEEDEEALIDLLLEQNVGIDVDKELEKHLTFGERMADKLTAMAGSWGFIIGFLAFLCGWILLNIFVFKKGLDPYPFILLNLLLSCVAALQAPVIMMSQNRSSKKDSLRSKNDYRTDLKSELILEELHQQMTEIQANQRKILRELDKNDEQN